MTFQIEHLFINNAGTIWNDLAVERKPHSYFGGPESNVDETLHCV